MGHGMFASIYSDIENLRLYVWQDFDGWNVRIEDRETSEQRKKDLAFAKGDEDSAKARALLYAAQILGKSPEDLKLVWRSSPGQVEAFRIGPVNAC